MGLKITSSAFAEGEYIPKKYTGQGKDVSPALSWVGAVENVQSFAIICDDPDAPRGTWVHWVIYNIPAGVNSLAEAVAGEEVLGDGTAQGITDFGRVGYGGPMPPAGKAHRYFFKLYALDTMLNLPSTPRKADVLEAMEGHVVAEAELMGLYKRQ